MNKKMFNLVISMVLICVFVLKPTELSYAYNKTETELVVTDMASNHLQYKSDFITRIANNELPIMNENEIQDNNSEEETTQVAEVEIVELELDVTTQEVPTGYDNTIAYACSNIIDPYDGYITEYMDLSNRKDITVDHMRTLIERYTKNHPESKFIGTEQAFIDAANQTGLDPIFLFALAGHESGWYVSDLHGSKNNPYSINMTDENPSGGYYMGDSFYDGIVNGAQWIKDNYYNNGYTTLYSMIYGGRQYASTTDQWIKDIKSIMNKCYSIIF